MSEYLITDMIYEIRASWLQGHERDLHLLVYSVTCIISLRILCAGYLAARIS